MKGQWVKWLFIPLFILWLFFILGSFFAVQKPFALPNALAMVNVLLNLLVAGWLVLVTLGTGSWLLQKFLPADLSFGETLVFGAGLGLGALGLLSFSLGLVGLFRPVIAYFVTIALSALFTPQLIRLFRQWCRWHFSNPPRLLPTVYCLLIGLFTLLAALLPPTDWDGLFYHLTGPKLYLQAGGIVGGIDLPHFNFPSLLEMLFAWAMLLRGDIAAKLLHTCFGLLLAGLVYLGASRFFSKKAARPALVLFLSMPMVSTLAGWAYNDLALAFYQLAAVYGVIRWQESASQRVSDLKNSQFTIQSQRPPVGNSQFSWLILSGIFAGLALGVKYTAFVTPLVVGGLILWRSATGPTTSPNSRFTFYALRLSITNLAVFILPAVLVALPWYVKSWIFTGNPVYPFLYSGFDGQFWDSFRAEWYAAAGTGIGWRPDTLLALPWLLTLGVRDMNYWDGRTGPLLLLFLPLMIGAGFSRRTDRPVALGPLLVYALAQFAFWTLGIIWSRSLWQSRLLLPGLVALTPVAGWLWADLPRFDWPRFSLSRFVNIAMGLTLFLTVIDVGLLTLKMDPWPYLVGLESRDGYLTRRLGAHYEAMQQLNEKLPSGAVVVFLWEPRSYYCQRDCRPDSILDTFPHLVYQYGSAEAIVRAWRQAGVTHVLLHRPGLEFVLNESPQTVDITVLTELQNRFLRPVFDVAGVYQVYTLVD